MEAETLYSVKHARAMVRKISSMENEKLRNALELVRPDSLVPKEQYQEFIQSTPLWEAPIAILLHEDVYKGICAEAKKSVDEMLERAGTLFGQHDKENNVVYFDVYVSHDELEEKLGKIERMENGVNKSLVTEYVLAESENYGAAADLHTHPRGKAVPSGRDVAHLLTAYVNVLGMVASYSNGRASMAGYTPYSEFQKAESVLGEPLIPIHISTLAPFVGPRNL